MRKLFKSKITFLLAVILLVTVTAGATLAFIVAMTDTLRNLFTDANVSCVTTYNEQDDTWTITNDGDVEAYIRVAVVPYLTNASNVVFWENPIVTVEYGDGSQWTVIGDHGYHYYKVALPAGESVVFGSVIVNTEADDGYDYDVTKVTVNAEAFQVGSAEALEDAWGVAYADGNFTAVDVCPFADDHENNATYANVDDEYHKLWCSECGIVYGFARHNNASVTDNGDGTHSGTCDCGFVFTSTPHTVSYTYVDGVTHTAFCTMCGHTQIENCTYNVEPFIEAGGTSEFHRNVCKCGAGEELARHELTTKDNHNGTHSLWCATCGYVVSTANHTLMLSNTTENDHTYTCSACGYSADPAPHELKTVSAGVSGHRTVCAVCNYGSDAQPDEHDMSVRINTGNANNHVLKCSSCEYSITEDHDVKYSVLEDDIYRDTYHHVECDLCGYSENLEHTHTYTMVDATTHTVGCENCDYQSTVSHDLEYEQIDGTKHTVRCRQCPYTEEVEHTFEYADLGDGSHRATCELCNYTTTETHEMSVYENSDSGLFHLVKCSRDCGYSYEEVHNISNVPDPEDTGKHIPKCNADGCGYTGVPVEHTFTYTDDGDGVTHTVSCDCGYKEKVGHDFSYDKTDTTHTPTCNFCSFKASPTNHTKSYSNVTVDGHTWTCTGCDANVTEAHDTNPTCVCGFKSYSDTPLTSLDFYTVDDGSTQSNQLYTPNSFAINGHHKLGLYGWFAYNKPITHYGHRVDGGNIQWRTDAGTDTGYDVLAAGGQHARRFHIQLSLYGLSAGQHTVEFYVKLEDGSEHRLGSLQPNIFDPPNVTAMIIHAENYPNSADGFTINGDIGNLYDDQEYHWVPSVGATKVVDIKETDTAGFYGWVALWAELVDVGYYWNDMSNGIIWQGGLGSDTEPAVLEKGGKRFHIQAPASTAPGFGQQEVRYVLKLQDGSIITHESWMLNIQPADSGS